MGRTPAHHRPQHTLQHTSMPSALISIVLALPVVLCLCRLLLKRQQSSYPTWTDIDADVLKRGGSAKKLEAAADADVIVIGSSLGGSAAQRC